MLRRNLLIYGVGGLIAPFPCIWAIDRILGRAASGVGGQRGIGLRWETDMLKELKPAFLMMVVMTVLTGLIYPAVITGDRAGDLSRSGQRQPDRRRTGRWSARDSSARTSRKPEYFHPRPSAAGSGYDPTASGGSNLGPTSAKLINGTTKMDDKKNEVVDFDGIKDRIVHYCLDNDIAYESSVPLDAFKDAQGNLDDVKLIKAFNDDKAPLVFTPKTPIPADAVTASASGLDPHISPANAEMQAARVAKARGVSAEQVQQVVANTPRDGPGFPRRAARQRPGAQSGPGSEVPAQMTRSFRD